MCDDIKDMPIRQSFNRYMVECESVGVDERIVRSIGFNRYMVECE